MLITKPHRGTHMLQILIKSRTVMAARPLFTRLRSRFPFLMLEHDHCNSNLYAQRPQARPRHLQPQAQLLQRQTQVPQICWIQTNQLSNSTQGAHGFTTADGTCGKGTGDEEQDER
jgi:hypothetical protein